MFSAALSGPVHCCQGSEAHSTVSAGEQQIVVGTEQSPSVGSLHSFPGNTVSGTY